MSHRSRHATLNVRVRTSEAATASIRALPRTCDQKIRLIRGKALPQYRGATALCAISPQAFRRCCQCGFAGTCCPPFSASFIALYGIISRGPLLLRLLPVLKRKLALCPRTLHPMQTRIHMLTSLDVPGLRPEAAVAGALPPHPSAPSAFERWDRAPVLDVSPLVLPGWSLGCIGAALTVSESSAVTVSMQFPAIDLLSDPAQHAPVTPTPTAGLLPLLGLIASWPSSGFAIFLRGSRAGRHRPVLQVFLDAAPPTLGTYVPMTSTPPTWTTRTFVAPLLILLST